MKRKKIVSVIGLLVLIVSATAFFTGCPQQNDVNSKNDTDVIKGIFGIKSTGSAFDIVKGTVWEPDLQKMQPDTIPNDIYMINGEPFKLVFAQNENVVSLKVLSHEIDVATYTVKDKTVIFDLSSVFNLWKNMTLDNFIEIEKKILPILIKELETAFEKETDQKIKSEMEEALKDMKDIFNGLQNPTPELKEAHKEMLTEMKTQVNELEQSYKQINAALNSDNSELSFNISDVGEIILKKQK